MQECPCCLESFSSDELALPPCGIAKHRACEECTHLWYEKQQKQSCLVCRFEKIEHTFLELLHWFVNGFVFVFSFMWIMNNPLLFDRYFFLVCCAYFYVYQTFFSIKRTKKTWISCAMGAAIAVVCVGLSVLYLSFELRILSYFFIYISSLFGLTLHFVSIMPYILCQLFPNFSNIAALILRYVLVLGALFGYWMQLEMVYRAYLCFT